jgi:hypothetical protein
MVISSTHFQQKHIAKERGQHQLAQVLNQIERIQINKLFATYIFGERHFDVPTLSLTAIVSELSTKKNQK